MKALNIGIIGCGNISTTYLSLGPNFKAINVVAVADINMSAAEQRAAEYGVRAESVEALLAADDIDIVVNLTVPGVHYQVTKQILESGKHAYSEKPVVLTLEEAESLRRIAADKQRRVGSAPDTFLGGAHQAARAAIDSGKVGKVLSGTAHIMSHGMEKWHPNPDFFFQPGGGPVLDMGPYYITNLVQLLGPVTSVAAMSSIGFETRTIGNGDRQGQTVPVDTPTSIHALLKFASGANITLGASWDVWAHRHKEMELYGELGSIYIPDPNFFGGDVTIVDGEGQANSVETADHPFAINNQTHGDRELANYRCAGLADMAEGIAEGREHRCNLELAIHVVDVMTGILRAGELGQWVEMSTTCERPEPLSAAQAQQLLK